VLIGDEIHRSSLIGIVPDAELSDGPVLAVFASLFCGLSLAVIALPSLGGSHFLTSELLRIRVPGREFTSRGILRWSRPDSIHLE
jgi:hypothetical protein